MSILRHFRNGWRLLGVVRCLVRHDALFPLALLPLPKGALRILSRLGRKGVPGRPGERLARALEELGPAFVKLGQNLAVRDDLIGIEVARDLSRLQDRLPPAPPGTAAIVILAELGRPIADLFTSFAETPTAAASIAQVHRAVTTEGAVVAVKVLRPGIERLIERDLGLLLWLAEIVERLRPSLKRMRPVDTALTLATVTRRELDLRLEGAAAVELAENCASDPGFKVPAVDWTRTARRIVTFEWVEGLPADDRPGLIAAGHDPNRILERSAIVFFNQVFRDGMFHGDMHPGNMLIDVQGRIVALDFGIMGRIDLATRRHLARILLGFLTRDYAGVADVFVEAGFIGPDQDREGLKQALRSIGEPILGLSLAQISMGRVLGQLLGVAEQFEMRQRPDLILLQKTMVVAEGVGRRINPEVNIWEMAQPLVAEWVALNLGPQAQLHRAAIDTAHAYRSLTRLVVLAEERLRLLPSQPDVGWRRPVAALIFVLGLLLGLAVR